MAREFHKQTQVMSHGRVILLEDCNGKEHFIAYATGQFPDAQKHYHTVYKEILAVKNGIKKFEFHLIGHKLWIRLDNSAFPNILNFKHKVILEKKPYFSLKNAFPDMITISSI